MIDWTRVSDLKEEVGEEDFDMILGIFEEEVNEVVARLRTTTDRSRMAEDLHFLKGSALNLGFTAVGRLCEVGERLGAEGRIAEFDLQALLDAYDASWGVFRRGPVA